MCKQLYDLAVISHTPLNPESMTAFIERSTRYLKSCQKIGKMVAESPVITDSL